MNNPDLAADKLRRIENLWEKLRRTRTDTPEYKSLVNEIGSLSMEYHQLVDPRGHSISTGAVRQRNVCLDRADAVVRVSIDGLNEDEALRALKLANREAARRLEAPTRAKKLQYPITLRMLDNTGSSLTNVTEIRRQVNPAAQEFLFYLVAEDAKGRQVCARIELVRQVIQ
jgi:hypothetical protein